MPSRSRDPRVAEILAELRNGMRGRSALPLEAGASHDSGEEPAIAAPPAPGFASAGDGLEALDRSIVELEARWQLIPYRFVSRVPLLGRFIAGFRHLWNSVSTRWYLAPVLAQQNGFNSTVIRALVEIRRELEASRQRATRRDEVEALRGELARLGDEVSRLSAELEETRTRLRAADAEAVELRGLLQGLDFTVSELAASIQARLEELPRRAETAALAEQISQLARLAGEAQRRADSLASDATLTRHRLARLERRPWPAAERQVVAASPAPPPAAPPIDYFLFELRFRGDPQEIAAKHRAYLDIFAGCEDVLDIGCGRGEFLALLKRQGIPACGVEIDPDMVVYCRQRGLDVIQMDAVEFLAGLEDASLGGIFCAQVVEHLTSDYLLRMLDLAYHKLRPDAPIVIETVNPKSLVVFSSAFYIDPTHVKPVHPEWLRFALEHVGFYEVRFIWSSPPAEEARLRPLPIGEDLSAAERHRLALLNEDIEKLNGLIYGPQDYAAVARRFVWPRRSAASSGRAEPRGEPALLARPPMN